MFALQVKPVVEVIGIGHLLLTGKFFLLPRGLSFVTLVQLEFPRHVFYHLSGLLSVQNDMAGVRRQCAVSTWRKVFGYMTQGQGERFVPVLSGGDNPT